MKISGASFVVAIALVLCLVVAAGLLIFTPEPKTRVVVERLPVLEYTLVQKRSVRIPIYSRGVTRPATEISLVAEATGAVVAVDENFSSGGFFKAGDVLVRVDPTRFELNVIKKQSAVDKALLVVQETQAQAKVAQRGQRKNASQYALQKPQLKNAKSQLAAAEADLELAKHMLEKTYIRAPFDGRIKSTRVGVGQYLRKEEALATVYALDRMEVRLPISDVQLGLMETAFTHLKQGQALNTPAILSGRYAGRRYTWQGSVVRAEGARDDNRLLYVIAQVQDPYDPAHKRPPLEPGMFVEVEIRGREQSDIVALPRKALHGHNQVWTVDKDQRLYVRDVQVLYRGKQTVYISDGLKDGEQIALSNLDIVVNGMRVKLAEASPTVAGATQ